MSNRNLTVHVRQESLHPSAGDVVTYVMRPVMYSSGYSSGVMLHTVVPDNTSFNPVDSSIGWVDANGGVITALTPSGTRCFYFVGTLGGDIIVDEIYFSVRVDVDVLSSVEAVSFNVQVEDDGLKNPDVYIKNKSVTVTTPLVGHVTTPLSLVHYQQNYTGRTIPGGLFTFELYFNDHDGNAGDYTVTATVPDCCTYMDLGEGWQGLEDSAVSGSVGTQTLTTDLSDNIVLTDLSDNPVSSSLNFTVLFNSPFIDADGEYQREVTFNFSVSAANGDHLYEGSTTVPLCHCGPDITRRILQYLNQGLLS